MSDFHLLRPECIFLILPLAVLFFFKQIRPLKVGNWQSVIAPQLQKYMLYQHPTETSSNVLQWALWLASLLGILALAGPSWEKQESSVYRSTQGLVIGLDLSLSMTAQDNSPSRIQRAKYKIIDVLQKEQDQNIALIAYAGDAHVVSPLTKDINTITSMLPALDPYIMPSPGSNLVKLVDAAIELFEQGNSSPRTLLLVTDGVESNDIETVASRLKSANIKLAILAVGTEQGAPIVQPDGRFFKDSKGQVIMPPIELDNLETLASTTGARLARLANTDSDINRLMKSLSSVDQFNKTEDDNMVFDQWLDSGYWLVLPLLLLSLGAFRKGIVLSFALMILAQPQETLAANLPDILLNGDQRGAKYFEDNPEQAAKLFDNPKWQASSLYKAGKFQEALNIWQQFDDPESLYNQGNALAQLQKIDKAISAYEQALQKKPDLKDAQLNKALLEELQQQNQQQDQQSQDNSEQSNASDQQQAEQQNSQGQSADQQNQSQKDGQSQQGQASSEQQSGQKSDQANSDSENPLQQAQTDQEKQRQEEMAQHQESQQNDTSEESQELTNSTTAKSSEDLEQEQAMQQWIQRIPDDPGGLLRNKFLYQYQQRQGKTEQDGERKPW